MELPPRIRAIADRLGYGSEPVDVARALDVDVTLDDVSPWVRFSDANYTRTLVTRTDAWELRLLCFRPGQSTSLHAHGDSACAFRIVRGSATETTLGRRDRTMNPGEVVDEAREAHVHQVGNAAHDPLVSLHAYSPALPVDAPSSLRGHTVAVVGGGFAGAATVYHLLARGDDALRIVWIERGAWLGRGVAYDVENPVFRLNVPASKMSIDPADPSDFVTWADAGATPDAFLGRARYGAYVADRVGQAIRHARGKLRVVRGEALSLDDAGVHLADGRVIHTDAAVLATGIAPRIAPAWLSSDPRVIDAWDECALATLPREGRVLVLGSGLSALDVLALMNARGFRGQLVVMSRRGFLPRPHLEPLRPAPPLAAHVLASAPGELRGLLAWGRAIVRDAQRRGEPWQLGVDALRPQVAKLWRTLPPRDRARFVRSVRPYWDVLRHRAPADALATVEAWRARGALDVQCGSVTACEPGPAGLSVRVRRRGGDVTHDRFDAIVRCIGPALEHVESQSPLVSALIASGRAGRDAAGLGIVTDPHGAVLDASGRTSGTLFALGALRRASDWESTAVPEIARHAAEIAARLIG